MNGCIDCLHSALEATIQNPDEPHAQVVKKTVKMPRNSRRSYFKLLQIIVIITVFVIIKIHTPTDLSDAVVKTLGTSHSRSGNSVEDVDVNEWMNE